MKEAYTSRYSELRLVRPLFISWRLLFPILSRTLVIAAQNMPEGLAVAAPLRQAGVSRFKSLFWATASGLAEPLAAFIGLLSFGFIKSVVPFGLAFAGGAMIYVVSHELIPESHSHGFEKEATGGVVVGFLTMIFLQYLLS